MNSPKHLIEKLTNGRPPADRPVKILESTFITPTVKRFKVEKPKGYRYEPGQGTWIAVNKPGWEKRAKPFTFTSLTSTHTLELVIKIYDERQGVTHQLGLCRKDDELLISEPFGTITYHGPGFFFAGGTGVTPFIAILRQLEKDKQLKGHTLLCSNRTRADIIMGEELTKMLGKNFLNFITREQVIGFTERRIDRQIIVTLVQDFNQHFYVCGPESFVENISNILHGLGAEAESIVIEEG